MASIVQETIREVNLGKVPSRLSLYEQMIDSAEPLFELDGIKLEEACKKQAKNLMYYDLMLQECKTIEDTIKMKSDEVESQAFKRLMEHSNRALGTRDIQQYIKSEPQYILAQEILLEIAQIKRKLEAIVEALKSMGWSINNIVKLRIAQLEETIL